MGSSYIIYEQEGRRRGGLMKYWLERCQPTLELPAIGGWCTCKFNDDPGSQCDRLANHTGPHLLVTMIEDREIKGIIVWVDGLEAEVLKVREGSK